MGFQRIKNYHRLWTFYCLCKQNELSDVFSVGEVFWSKARRDCSCRSSFGMIGGIGDQERSFAFTDLGEIVFSVLGDAGEKQGVIAVQDLLEIVFGELSG
ncbi:hypothetical protein TNCT_380901 [Trichonephila clavata]|uniref:Uncharacterized protein n=1 Tax=Trichonephila clavata TaxID=2740835 RepID=A0A8X6HFR2_TRICU|nr:hypothetical protein TNCT_380901 [Trichonephila clavata]